MTARSRSGAFGTRRVDLLDVRPQASAMVRRRGGLEFEVAADSELELAIRIESGGLVDLSTSGNIDGRFVSVRERQFLRTSSSGR